MADSIDILVKLFDTLKSSTDKNESSTQQLIGQQQELVSYINNLPIKDLHIALTAHSKEAKTDIDDCTDTVSTTTNNLMDEIKKINNKVSKMIFVVIAAFSILMGSYVVIRSVADNNSQFDEWQEGADKAHTEILDNVTQQISNLRRELANNHNIKK